MKNEIEKLGNIQPENPHLSGNVYGIDGCSPTLMACTHGYGFGYVLEIKKAGVIIEKDISVCGGVFIRRYITFTRIKKTENKRKQNCDIITFKRLQRVG